MKTFIKAKLDEKANIDKYRLWRYMKYWRISYERKLYITSLKSRETEYLTWTYLGFLLIYRDTLLIILKKYPFKNHGDKAIISSKNSTSLKSTLGSGYIS